MQDLTGDPRFPAHLSVSSMSAGNTVASDPSLARTAPGSPSILPVPEATDNLPLPQFSAGPKIELNDPRRSGESAQPAPAGFLPDAWDDPGGLPEAPRDMPAQQALPSQQPRDELGRWTEV
jgi:hypothetical protein